MSHAVGLPDNASAALFCLLERHPRIRLVSVTREGEAFGVASGVWAGGKSPLVVVQNTALLESGDALRGTAVRMGIPLVFVVTCRGYARAAGKTPLPPVRPFTAEVLVDPRLDSVALLTEPTLGAWGIPYLHCVDFAGLARAAGISRVHSFEEQASYEQALPWLLQSEGPVAVVVRVEPGSERPLERGAPGEPPYLRPALAESTRRLRAELTGVR